MAASTIVLFGESERGDYSVPYYFDSLPQLADHLGNPPADSKGLFYAVQALLFRYPLLFLRVKEEGYSYRDYLTGIEILQRANYPGIVSAICLPGVGNSEIIEAIRPFSCVYHSLLIMNQADLYDYLYQANRPLSQKE